MLTNYIFSFVSREIELIEIAEDLCKTPSKCITTLFEDDTSKVALKMKKPKFSIYQTNIMMIPVKNIERTAIISVYCPAFATKLSVVNAWNPTKKSLLFEQTETQCGHPLVGKSNNAIKTVCIYKFLFSHFSVKLS